MTKDFAKLERPQEEKIPQEKKAKPILLWVIVLGLLMTLNIVVMLYKNKNQIVVPNNEIENSMMQQQTANAEQSKIVSEPTISVTSSVTRKTDQDTEVLDHVEPEEEPEETETVVSYDFYKKLPEVKVLEEIEVATVKTKAAQQAQTVQIKHQPLQKIEKVKENSDIHLSNYGYLLQVASFRKMSDANRLLNRLKEAGFSSVFIQEVIIKEQNWHRVMLGKFNSFDEMQSKRQGLKLMGLDSLLITIKS